MVIVEAIGRALEKRGAHVIFSQGQCILVDEWRAKRMPGRQSDI